MSPHLSEVSSDCELVGCGVRLLHLLRRAPSVHLELFNGSMGVGGKKNRKRSKNKIRNETEYGQGSKGGTSLSECVANAFMRVNVSYKLMITRTHFQIDLPGTYTYKAYVAQHIYNWFAWCSHVLASRRENPHVLERAEPLHAEVEQLRDSCAPGGFRVSQAKLLWFRVGRRT